jgi:hypothetical protein
VAALVELDQEGYVVCHWPLSYGVFEAEGVEAVLMKTAVESLIVEVYEIDKETALWLLDEVGIEYEVMLVEMLAEVFVGGIIELEGAGMLILVAAALVWDGIVLEATLRGVVDDVEGTALVEEDSAAEVVDELVLDSVIVTGSGTSTVTVGELTSITE